MLQHGDNIEDFNPRKYVVRLYIIHVYYTSELFSMYGRKKKLLFYGTYYTKTKMSDYHLLTKDLYIHYNAHNHVNSVS